MGEGGTGSGDATSETYWKVGGGDRSGMHSNVGDMQVQIIEYGWGGG